MSIFSQYVKYYCTKSKKLLFWSKEKPFHSLLEKVILPMSIGKENSYADLWSDLHG